MLANSLRNLVLGLSLVATTAAVGCAQPEEVEARASTTSKLLAPYKAVATPASVTAKFVEALGGVPVEIDRWEGYVAGTIENDENEKDDALFAVHLSGLDGQAAVAGITVALVEPGEPGKGDFDARFAAAPLLEVRFNNGSGIVATHSFVDGKSVAQHKTDPESDALLKRAFNDTTALLNAPKEIASGEDGAKSCVANYLAFVHHATHCVNDAANVDDCNDVRTAAINTAATCAGTKSANVLFEADKDGEGAADAKTNAIRPMFFGAIGDFFGGVFDKFFNAGTVGKLVEAIPSALGSLTGSQAVKSLATKIVGGNGIIDSVLSTLGEKQTLTEIGGVAAKLLPKLFGNAPSVGKVVASPQTGAVIAKVKTKAQLARERAAAAAAPK